MAYLFKVGFRTQIFLCYGNYGDIAIVDQISRNKANYRRIAAVLLVTFFWGSSFILGKWTVATVDIYYFSFKYLKNIVFVRLVTNGLTSFHSIPASSSAFAPSRFISCPILFITSPRDFMSIEMPASFS